jgi:hypothetical protein
MKGSLIMGIFAILASLAGCQKKPHDTLVEIKNQHYTIPWQHHPVVNREGNFHVRSQVTLSNGKEIRLLYDERNMSLLIQKDVPFLFGVNAENENELNEQITKILVDMETVYCTKETMESGLHFTCGIRIEDKNVNWTVNFDETDISLAPFFRKQAKSILDSYKGTDHAKPK